MVPERLDAFLAKLCRELRFRWHADIFGREGIPLSSIEHEFGRLEDKMPTSDLTTESTPADVNGPTLRQNPDLWAKQAPKRNRKRLVSDADITRMSKLLGSAEGLE